MSFLDQLGTDTPLSDSLRLLLEKTEIKKVECYPSDNSLYVYTQSAVYPTIGEYLETVGLLQKQFSTDAHVYCIPLGSNDVGQTLEQDLFLAVLAEISHSYRIWRNSLVWHKGSDFLAIRCGNPLILERLKRKNFPDTVARLYCAMTCAAVSVKLEYEASLWVEPKNYPAVSHSAICADLPKTTTVAKKTTHSDKVILGRSIRGSAVHLVEVQEEDNQVIVAGAIFDLQVRVLKSGRSLFIFSISDRTDSITCKYFAEEGDGSHLECALKDAKRVKVRGKTRVDQFSHELVLMVNDICQEASAPRRDTAAVKRVELHLHTQMSSMDGISSLKKLLLQAQEMGHDTLAITDHGVVQAFPEAYELGKKLGIKIIYGVEAYLFDDAKPENQKPKTYHCIILAKNQTGLKNLYKLVTESHLRYFKSRPRIPKRLLAYAREGLVVGSACEAGELIQHIIQKPEDEDGLRELAQFYDYLEIQPIENNFFMLRNDAYRCKTEEDLRDINRRLWNLGRELNKPVVATCDVHFAEKEDAVFRGIIMAGRGFKDAEEQAPLFYRTTEEMLEAFDYLGEAAAHAAVVENPRRIVADFEDLQPVPSGLHAPVIAGAEQEIMTLTYAKAHRLYGDTLPECVAARIEKELDAIIGNDFAVLYLIAHKLVRRSNEDGYVVGSRGSVGSSVVAFLADITEVNALPPHYRCPECQHSEFFASGTYGSGVDMPDADCPHCGAHLLKDGFDIPFEIFLGFKGDKVPDIDLNFSGAYQPRAHQYVEELFGMDQVFRAGTISTVAQKTAYGFVAAYLENSESHRRSAEVNRLRDGCTGVKKTTGQHPGGLMVIPRGEDVHRFTPLQRPADDVKSNTVTTHFDYHSISERLVKLDILGHDDPTVIKMLEDLTGVDIATVPLDDPATLSLFSSVEALGLTEETLHSPVATYGIPEFNTKFVRQMLEDTKPQSFSDLLRISGFSHGTDVWLNNAQDLIRDGTAQVSETISTRDDIMLYLMQHGMEAVNAFAIMERVRKGRGLNDENLAYMKDARIPDWFVASCEKIKYLFPKAHAVAYVMMAFRIAWFKLNHPLAFYASYFTIRGADDFDAEVLTAGEEKVRAYIKDFYNKGLKVTSKETRQISVAEVALELYLRGYTFLPVDLEKSSAQEFVIEGKALRPPFIGVNGLGRTMACGIVNARESHPFTSLEDLQSRGHVGEAMAQELRRLGVLGDLPESDQILLF